MFLRIMLKNNDISVK